MSKQLTPAQELIVLHRAATILASILASQSYGDCLDPEQFNPAGKCANPSKALCGECFLEWAVNKATQEMEANHE